MHGIIRASISTPAVRRPSAAGAPSMQKTSAAREIHRFNFRICHFARVAHGALKAAQRVYDRKGALETKVGIGVMHQAMHWAVIIKVSSS